MPRGRRDPRRANGHARDKLRARVIASEDVCWLCGMAVDKSLPPGHPYAPEVDEVVPVSKGGDPLDRDNCRLAHRICNERRGNRPAGAPVTAPMIVALVSRDW